MALRFKFPHILKMKNIAALLLSMSLCLACQPKASEVSGFLEGEEFTLRAPFSARVDTSNRSYCWMESSLALSPNRPISMPNMKRFWHAR